MRVLDQGVAKCMGCERRKAPNGSTDNKAEDKIAEFKTARSSAHAEPKSRAVSASDTA